MSRLQRNGDIKKIVLTLHLVKQKKDYGQSTRTSQITTLQTRQYDFDHHM
jgi:hypothetical protein